MRGISGVVMTFSAILALILVLSLIAALLAATAPDGEFCVSRLCAAQDHFRSYLAVGALAGLISVLLLAGKEAGAATGAGVALLAMAVIAAFVSPERFSAGESKSSEPESLQDRLAATIEEAQEIELTDGALPPTEVPLIHGGLAAKRFTLEESARLRIDVTADETFGADPFFEIFKEEDWGRREVAENDDGGRNLNARVEREFEPGAYIIVMRNINDAHLRAPGLTFTLEIAPVDLRRSLAERTMALTAGAGAVCRGLSGEGCRAREISGTVGADGVADDDFYLVDVELGAADACLIVDVDPAGDGDTVAGLFNLNRSVLASNDDRAPGDLGTRFVHRIEADDGGRQSFLLHVGAFSGAGTAYSLWVELRRPDENGRCLTSNAFTRNRDA